MQKNLKRLLACVLAVVMLVGVAPMADIGGTTIKASATSKTADEAMAWCESLLGSKVGTGQCVALIQAYYEYLGVSAVSGNGCDYATNSVPSGWSRVYQGVPEKGDILVYTGAKYGHVAIYAGGTTSYHQNMSGLYVEKKTSWAYNKSWYSDAEGGTKSYWGYIRPDFSSGSTSQDDKSFYWLSITDTDNQDVGLNVNSDPVDVTGKIKIWMKQSGFGSGNSCDVNISIDGVAKGTLYQDDNGYFSYILDPLDYNKGVHQLEAIIRSADDERIIKMNFQTHKTFWFHGVTTVSNEDAGIDMSSGTFSISDSVKLWMYQEGFGTEQSCDVNINIDGIAKGTLYQDESGLFSFIINPTEYSKGVHYLQAIIRSATDEKTITLNFNVLTSFDWFWISDLNNNDIGIDINGEICITQPVKIWVKQEGFGTGTTCDVNIDIDGKAKGTLYQDDNGYFSYVIDPKEYSDGTHCIKAIIRNSSLEKTIEKYYKIENQKYEVTFVTNSDTPNSTKTVTYGSTYGTLPTPTRTGYTFDGWYTSATGGTKITSSTKVTITANQTLYAHWTCNHSYTAEIVTAATCNATGTQKFTCKTCGNTYTETIAIDPNNHTGGTEVKNAKSATCGEAGYTGDTCCKGCSAVLSKGEVIPATGTHSFGEWKQSKAPTCTAEGEEVRICTVCGLTESMTLDRLPHSYISSVIEPTCEKDGAIVYECVCGDSYSDIIPATGHTDNDNDGVCDDCGKDIQSDANTRPDQTQNCPCICHKTGFMGFIWKIICVIYKIFKVNKTCACGVSHY